MLSGKGLPDAHHVAQEAKGHLWIRLRLVLKEQMKEKRGFAGRLPFDGEEQVAERIGIEDGLVDRGRVFEAGPVTNGGDVGGEVVAEEGAGDGEIGKRLVVEGIAGRRYGGIRDRGFGHCGMMVP